MKPEIELPPKVKCWRCEGTGRIIGLNDHYGPCDCDDGERYVFDDLAVAVAKAGLNMLIEDGHGLMVGPYRADLINRVGDVVMEYGPSPTTALLMAITKFNEE